METLVCTIKKLTDHTRLYCSPGDIETVASGTAAHDILMLASIRALCAVVPGAAEEPGLQRRSKGCSVNIIGCYLLDYSTIVTFRPTIRPLSHMLGGGLIVG